MNPLTDVLPPKARKVLYAVLFLIGLAFAAWNAADGDWLEFVGGLVTSLSGAVAVSNVTPADARHRLEVEGH